MCVVLLAYFATRLTARRASQRLKSRCMEVVDTLGVAPDAQIVLVRAGGEYFLLAKAQKQLTFLAKLEAEPEGARAEAAKPFGFAGGFRAALESGLAKVGQRGNTGNDNARWRENSGGGAREGGAGQ